MEHDFKSHAAVDGVRFYFCGETEAVRLSDRPSTPGSVHDLAVSTVDVFPILYDLYDLPHVSGW